MNFRDLQYLVAVADSLSFRKAAEYCHVSQPTLSAQIKKVESELNVTLFERNNKKVMVTDTGMAVIRSARLILREKEHIKSIANMACDPFSGTFRLGAFPTLAPYLFPQVVPFIMKKMPGLRLVLVEEKTDRLIELLENGDLDATLLAMPFEHVNFESQKLFRDVFYLAVPDNHPLGKNATVCPDMISNHNLLLLEDGHCLRDQALDICHMHGIREEHDLRASSLETLREMIKAGTGISLIPKVAIKTSDSGICYIPFEDPAPFRTVGLFYRKTTGRREVIQELAGIIKTCLHHDQAL